jgi:hypothetical protein
MGRSLLVTKRIARGLPLELEDGSWRRRNAKPGQPPSMALAAPSNARAGWREKSKTTLAQRPRLGCSYNLYQSVCMGINNLLLGSPAPGRPLGFKFNLNFNSKATQSGVVESKVTPSAPAFNHLLSLFFPQPWHRTHAVRATDHTGHRGWQW